MQSPPKNFWALWASVWFKIRGGGPRPLPWIHHCVLIHHIYTIFPQKVIKSGICLANISSDFFCHLSPLPFFNLLDLLSVENIFAYQLLNFYYQWHKKQLPGIFDPHFHYASDVHLYNTRYARANFYKQHFRTNAGKQTTWLLNCKL